MQGGKAEAGGALGMLWGCSGDALGLLGGTRGAEEKERAERSGQKQGVKPVTREEAILAEVTCALPSACYLVWGQLAPVHVTLWHKLGSKSSEVWDSLAGPFPFPSWGSLEQDQAPGSCQKRLSPDTRNGHRWHSRIFQRRWSEAEGTAERRDGR